eukprot:2900125-Prymnesium_polylepis.1
MCSGSKLRHHTAREARSESPRGGSGCTSDVESASDRAWSRYLVRSITSTGRRSRWPGQRRARGRHIRASAGLR